MSKLNRTGVNKDGVEGKGKKRHNNRQARFDNSPSSDKTKTKHVHHRPGSMNMKKAGR